MIKIIALLKRKEGLTQEEFAKYWKEKHAQYSDGSNILEPVSILPGTFDPLSVFYAFRLYLREDNSNAKFHVSDGKKFIISSVKIIKREKISRCLKEGYDGLIIGAITRNGLDDLLVQAKAQNVPVVDMINGVNPENISARVAAEYWDNADNVARYLVRTHPTLLTEFC